MLEGSATLTANDPERHGPPVTIVAGDMVTFPKNWSGVWEVHSFLRKVYAFFDREGLRVDEDIDEEEEDNSAPVGRGVGTGLGCGVGSGEGCGVGSALGWPVGSALGCGVGSGDG